MFEWATGFPAGSMYAPWPCRGASTSRPLRSTAECSCTSWCTSISGSGSGSWGSWLGTSGGRSGGATRSTRSRSKLEQRQRGWKDAMESTGSTVLAHAGGPTWCASRLGLAERPGAGGPDYGDFHVRDRWSARIGPAWRPQRGDRASPGAPGRRIIAREWWVVSQSEGNNPPHSQHKSPVSPNDSTGLGLSRRFGHSKGRNGCPQP